MLAHGSLGSIIFWGPPGTWQNNDCAAAWQMRLIWQFEPISAVFDGVGELRKVFDRACPTPPAGTAHTFIC
jgi:putative ATPase